MRETARFVTTTMTDNKHSDDKPGLGAQLWGAFKGALVEVDPVAATPRQAAGRARRRTGRSRRPRRRPLRRPRRRRYRRWPGPWSRAWGTGPSSRRA